MLGFILLFLKEMASPFIMPAKTRQRWFRNMRQPYSVGSLAVVNTGLLEHRASFLFNKDLNEEFSKWYGGQSWIRLFLS